MIEVIKHGNVYISEDDFPVTTTCPICGCKFRFDREDIDPVFYVQCPECGYLLTLGQACSKI